MVEHRSSKNETGFIVVSTVVKSRYFILRFRMHWWALEHHLVGIGGSDTKKKVECLERCSSINVDETYYSQYQDQSQ